MWSVDPVRRAHPETVSSPHWQLWSIGPIRGVVRWPVLDNASWPRRSTDRQALSALHFCTEGAPTTCTLASANRRARRIVSSRRRVGTSLAGGVGLATRDASPAGACAPPRSLPTPRSLVARQMYPAWWRGLLLAWLGSLRLARLAAGLLPLEPLPPGCFSPPVASSFQSGPLPLRIERYQLGRAL